MSLSVQEGSGHRWPQVLRHRRRPVLSVPVRLAVLVLGAGCGLVHADTPALPGAAVPVQLAAASIGTTTPAPSGSVRPTAAPQPDPEKTGGETTVFADGRMAFSFPAANLTEAERTRFVVGNSFFRRNWVAAPASTRARDGLGPLFIARSCGGCHVQDGRGPLPKRKADGTLEDAVALLIRLSVPGKAENGGPVPEPMYGEQLGNAGVKGVPPEAHVEITHTPVEGKFADGTAWTLQAPHYQLTNLGYGPMAKDVMISPRLAPQVIGMGLLEAIPELEILKNAAEQQAMKGPIKGVPNRVWDNFAGRKVIGRFGWKANTGTVAHQSGAAFVNDIGITSPAFPEEACMPGQKACVEAPHGGNAPGRPEADHKVFDDVVFYQATLAPPARRGIDDPVVKRGEKLFHEAGCQTCHRPSYTTGRSPLADSHPQFTSPALENQVIWPYTDLLLHDMGEDLADGRPDFEANGRQWRTPPLWGIGLIRQVNGHTRLLHDGRADGVLEAVLWHGGEASVQRARVVAMPAADREALVRFVESL